MDTQPGNTRDLRRRGWRPARDRQHRASERGQALVEMAIVTPVLFLLIAGIIQFGLIFWSQQTLTQVARDTGRWAATQTNCSNPAPVVNEANQVAQGSTLFGYAAGSWTGSDVQVSWSSSTCPEDNSDVVWVTIDIDHSVPVFFPFIPGGGDISTSAEFRMEPAPA